MSLFRTAARASVATRVIGNTHRRQQQRWAAQDAAAAQFAPAAPAAPASAPAGVPACVPASAPAAPEPAPAPAPDMSAVIEQLTQLAQLRDAGVLTDAEFEAQKQKVLAGSAS